ncbi:hypothetical protein A0J61_01019 [Choanephora cucurbitarum]|uniref:Uncharacterized protein n=1 Tax=Choanephora cucurbitarum TaxID=101091 RepID=A0A1C7NP89_9FUNG|nr:hypothetical protein A0J61_01019 [Choanephora cucurbitarum]
MLSISRCQVHHVPATWADCSLLPLNFSISDGPIGPEAWGSYPTLLMDSHFYDLLIVSADIFVLQVNFAGLRRPLEGSFCVHSKPHDTSLTLERQQAWEQLKLLQ